LIPIFCVLLHRFVNSVRRLLEGSAEVAILQFGQTLKEEHMDVGSNYSLPFTSSSFLLLCVDFLMYCSYYTVVYI